MPDYRSQSIDGLNQRENRSGRGELASDEAPPMSRLFIICNKSHTEEDFRDAFKKFGAIEDIWLVKDKHTQENKGIAYVKYAKTSDAAKAQEEMNGKCIGKTDRPLKVLVAANRNEGSNKSENEHERYVRLFIVIPNGESEEEIREDFSKWGNVEKVTIVKDKETGNAKGFGYVRYSKFYHAALAFENCRPKYKAVFAEPKGSTKNQREQNGRGYEDNWNSLSRNRGSDMGGFVRMQNVTVPQRSSLEVIVSGSVNQDQLWRLFDIIPGLDYCQITKEYGPRTNEATVVYNNPEAAIYAKDKLHGLEYPMGERIIVKLSGMGSSPKNVERNLIDNGSKKECICSVPLPPAQQLAPSDAVVAQRLFIVVASSLPQSILRNVFSCWKGLIDVYLLANKNCGYVKYADRESAMKAIQTLNDAEICGTKIKVMEAEERGGGGDGDGDVSGRKRLRRN